MSLVSVETARVPQANAQLVDRETLRRRLEANVQGEVRFDKVSRALYSTDASVYQIEPIGVLVAKSQEDVIAAVRICNELRCPITMRGGGTSQAGQAIGEGLQIDISKYVNRLLEVNVEERWARVEPGIVLDELNALLKKDGLRFAPDISTASRATVGGMIANNSAGARSVLYGKTIDHVLEQKVLLSDGTVTEFRPLSTDELVQKCSAAGLEGDCYRAVRRVAIQCAEEVDRRFPKVMRRVGGYNLDEFTKPGRPFDMTKVIVGSEGTLGVVLEAKVKLVPLPKHKSVLTIEFPTLLDALGATPEILRHNPSAVEVMDKFILDHTKENPALDRVRKTFIKGDPGGLLCVEFYDDDANALRPRMEAVEASLKDSGALFYYALDLPAQARVWSLREAGLGLSMAMKDDAKSLSFVEDTAVAPEKLRDFIERFMAVIRKHDTVAGVYAHASVGCLHVRPVVNMKTEAGVQKFQAIANEIADLVIEFGGALSGEHGDGLVRSSFMRKMFGPVIYDAFRTIKRTFDPNGILNPGKIVDSPPIEQNLRYGASYRAVKPATYFDYSEYGGMSGAVEMCSGVGACRKKLEGTMCPSYMVTRDEKHTTRGRANVLRLAMSGKLGVAGLGDSEVKDVLSLCLECRACKAECPVGVDVARFKSEFLADYYKRHGVPLRAKALGFVADLSPLASQFAPVVNLIARSGLGRWMNDRFLGVDSRRRLPAWSSRPLDQRVKAAANPAVYLFKDTFTNYYNPEVGEAALKVLQSMGVAASLAPNGCCGRPLISQGLLQEAQARAPKQVELLYPIAKQKMPILFCEPSCLSAMKEDLPDLLRGEQRAKAREVAAQCMLFEEYVEQNGEKLKLREGPKQILLHGHCHQKSMGLLATAKALLGRVPGATVTDLDAGCCGMAGSFGYAKENFEVSKAIGERKLLPAARAMSADSVLVAAGVSCRHQVEDLASKEAMHPAILLSRLLKDAAK